jgi:hypothetical protein
VNLRKYRYLVALAGASLQTIRNAVRNGQESKDVFLNCSGQPFPWPKEGSVPSSTAMDQG